jgi:hypothetical protein
MLYPNGNELAYHEVGSGIYVQRGGKWSEFFQHETVTNIDPELLQPAPRRKS